MGTAVTNEWNSTYQAPAPVSDMSSIDRSEEKLPCKLVINKLNNPCGYQQKFPILT